jgi:predicted component of type VI protein secretion system
MQRRRLVSAVVLVMAVVGAVVAGCASAAEATPALEVVQLELPANRGW